MKRFLTSVLLGTVAVATGFLVFKSSLHLAASRIYHVDECQNVFMARILATGQAGNYFASASLFLIPLSWLAGGANQSGDLFASARLVSVLIFWLNLVLIALATGEKLLSRRGVVALLGAATLTPLWDSGFEVRAENLLLSGLLATWCVVRWRSVGISSCFLVGALAVAMQFTAREACAYTLPLAFGIVLFAPPRVRAARRILMLAWLIGAGVMLAGIFVLYRLAGVGDLFSANLSWFPPVAENGERFELWKILGRLAVQTPLLLALLTAAVTVVCIDLRRSRNAALKWEGIVPEVLLLLIALAVLFLQPFPQPHDLGILVPVAFLPAFRYATSIFKEIWAVPLGRSLVFTLLLFAHFIPFLTATRRHLNWPNHRQENLMRVAERLTDAAKDPVYDGIGMVPMRRSIHFNWFLHSLNIRDFRKGGELRVREMLADQPAAVIIQNYRTSWLPSEDHDFIRKRYVALADDIWVLGQILEPGGGQFEIYHPGRYHISTKESSHLAGTSENTLTSLLEGREPVTVEPDFVATLNGLPLTNRTVELAVGIHRIQTGADCTPAVVWAGPRVMQPPRVSEGSHQRLFVNWY